MSRNSCTTKLYTDSAPSLPTNQKILHFHRISQCPHCTPDQPDTRGCGSLTQALRLKQKRFVHAHVTAPAQEVGGVVTGEEGAGGGVFSAHHPLHGKTLQETGNQEQEIRNRKWREEWTHRASIITTIIIRKE